MKGERVKGWEDFGGVRGGDSKETELGVTGQDRGSPLRRAATSLPAGDHLGWVDAGGEAGAGHWEELPRVNHCRLNNLPACCLWAARVGHWLRTLNTGNKKRFRKSMARKVSGRSLGNSSFSWIFLLHQAGNLRISLTVLQSASDVHNNYCSFFRSS